MLIEHPLSGDYPARSSLIRTIVLCYNGFNDDARMLDQRPNLPPAARPSPLPQNRFSFQEKKTKGAKKQDRFLLELALCQLIVRSDRSDLLLPAKGLNQKDLQFVNESERLPHQGARRTTNGKGRPVAATAVAKYDSEFAA